ncbi:hypothetical protein ACJMK2_003677 [Sinanodonta woodiana]|uniref:Uncharacterized protein n=1 Tax=Sinanodonta woodiana TaxID=1069815 RepID=A0ABD3Y244_SINWO
MIEAYLKDEQEDWGLHLGCLAAAYRDTPHESTGMTPNLLMLGREVRLPAEIVHGRVARNDEITTYGEYVGILRDIMQHAHDIARKLLATAAKRQRDQHDVKLCQFGYIPGDLVWILNELRYKGISPKLQKLYAGPFIVKKKINDLNFKLLHHNKIKPYVGESPPVWVNKMRKKIVIWNKTAEEKNNNAERHINYMKASFTHVDNLPIFFLSSLLTVGVLGLQVIWLITNISVVV